MGREHGGPRARRGWEWPMLQERKKPRTFPPTPPPCPSWSQFSHCHQPPCYTPLQLEKPWSLTRSASRTGGKEEHWGVCVCGGGGMSFLQWIPGTLGEGRGHQRTWTPVFSLYPRAGLIPVTSPATRTSPLPRVSSGFGHLLPQILFGLFFPTEGKTAQHWGL